MAQKWLNLANGSATNFAAVVWEFNDRQMSDTPKPVMQQQQQISAQAGRGPGLDQSG
jgi:hypothetical protein